MATIRIATTADASAIWSILRPVFRAGETYTIARTSTKLTLLPIGVGETTRLMWQRTTPIFLERTICVQTTLEAAITLQIAGI